MVWRGYNSFLSRKRENNIGFFSSRLFFFWVVLLILLYHRKNGEFFRENKYLLSFRCDCCFVLAVPTAKMASLFKEGKLHILTSHIISKKTTVQFRQPKSRNKLFCFALIHESLYCNTQNTINREMQETKRKIRRRHEASTPSVPSFTLRYIYIVYICMLNVTVHTMCRLSVLSVQQ